MSSRWISLPVLCAVAAAVMAAPVLAQDKPEAKGGAPQMNEEMRAWIKAGTPNQNHERLSYMIGKWKTSVKMWEPGKPEPSVSSGTNVNEWLLDKRYVSTHYNGTFMGEPFEGMGITGYDNTKKKYTSSWMDSMSTSIMTSLGTIDDSRKVITFHGTHDDPITGQMDKPVKTIVRMLNETKFVVEMYDRNEAGAWYMNLELVYTRS